jgi:hypothetical protein
MIRRVLTLVVDQLAAPAGSRAVPRHVVPVRAAPPPTSEPVPNRSDP